MFHSDFQASIKNMPPSILKQALYRSHRKTGVPIPELSVISKAHLFHAKIVEAAIEYSTRKYRVQQVLASRRKAEARLALLESIAALKDKVDRLHQASPPRDPTPAIATPGLNHVPRDTDVAVVPRGHCVPAPPEYSLGSTRPCPSQPHTAYRREGCMLYTPWECNSCRRIASCTYHTGPDLVVRPHSLHNNMCATPQPHTRT